MSSRQDLVVDIWANQTVAAGQLLYSPLISMMHGNCWSLHSLTQQSCAGTISYFVSNLGNQTWTFTASGFPPSPVTGSATIAANGQHNFNFGNNTSQVNFGFIWFSFSATAAGVINSCFNLRRFPG